MSESFFEKNLKAMEKWYPKYAEAIRAGNYKKDDIEIVTEYSLDGNLIYKIKQEDRVLYLNGKRNTKEPLNMWRERLGELHDGSPIILVGIGSGLYLKKIIANTSEKVNIIVYEPSVSIFLKTLEMVDLEEDIKNRPIAFVVEGLNGNELLPIIRKLISLETMEFLKQEIHPNYQQVFMEKVVSVLKETEKRFKTLLMNENTGKKFSTVIARCQLQNMKYLCDGYNTKKLSQAIPHDVPAILVAAGPSLNYDIETLKKAKGKAFILAVDTAVKPLIKAGIKPDAFITIDSKKPTSLTEIKEIKQVPIIVPPVANYDILREQKGKKIFYFGGERLPYMVYRKVNKVLPEVSTGGSVACSGFSLLYKMGFDTIILVGQDLAYTNNKSHADGTFHEIMPEKNTKHMIQVKGNYEETVPTRADFKMYIEWFNMYIWEIKKRANIRVINATSGGAYLENTELMNLQDALAETCTREVNFEKCIENMESEFTQEEREKVIEFLRTLPKEFGTVKKDAKALFKVYQKILNINKSGKTDKDAYLKQLKKAKKLREEIEKNMTYQLISGTISVAQYIIKSESLYETYSLQEEMKVVAEQGKKYCKLLEKCAELLEEYAEEVLLTE